MEALPNGSESKNAKSFSGGSPKSSRMTSAMALAGHRGNFVLQFREFRTIGVGQQIAAGRKYLAELDEHGSEFLACTAKVLRTRLIAGLMFDQFIVNNADAMTRKYSQDFAVTLALRDHCALNSLCRNILLLMIDIGLGDCTVTCETVFSVKVIQHELYHHIHTRSLSPHIAAF